MGKPKMLGMTRMGLPNGRADLRRAKAWKRNREYTDKHQAVLERNQDKKLIQEKEARFGNSKAAD